MHSSLYYRPMKTKENKSLYEAVDVPSVGWRGYRPTQKLEFDTLTLDNAWNHGGLFLFAANQPQNPDNLLKHIKEYERNNPQGRNEIRLIWLNNPEGPLTGCPRLKLISGTTSSSRTDNNFFINLGNAFTFSITSHTPFQFVSKRERLEFKIINNTHPNIQFMEDITEIVDSVVYLPFGGKDGGAFRFAIQAASEKLYDGFDVGLKYFYEDYADDCKRKEQNYPVFEKEPLQSLNFRVSLDPLDPFNRKYSSLPNLGLRSYMAFYLGTKPLPSHFRTSFGRTIQLRPNVHFEEEGSGGEPRPTADSGILVFSPRYKGAISQCNSAYTIPQGNFSLSVKDTELSDGQAVRMLCGSTGTETISFVPRSNDNAPYQGDQLLFVSGKNAFWPSNPVDPGRPKQHLLLTDEAYTAWVAVRPNDARLPESLPISYSSQPEDQPHYRPSAEGVSSFYEPTLYDWTDDEELSVPLVPLLGIQRNDMETFLDLERYAIAPNRKQLMDERSISPPIRSNTPSTSEGWSTTPHGLLVHESAGSWSELRFGQNDRNNRDFTSDSSQVRDILRFSGLSTTFRNVLLSDRLFMVISVNNGTLWSQFDDLVTISGWPFRIAVPNSNADTFCNVLIFKYGPGTLEKVIRDPASWTNAELFNNTAQGELKRLSEWMSSHCRLDVPLEDLPPEFVPFYQTCYNPEWNGVVALNVDIVKEQMPNDLIGLLGGMNSENLRAHHIGLDSTRVEWDDAGELRVDKPSSLFAYVDYKDNTDPNWKNEPYDFRVTELKARFANSKIRSFHGKMELLVRKLYGSPISIAGTSEPVLPLTGTIERHEGIPTYVFQMKKPVQTKIMDESVKLKNIQLSKISFQTTDASDKNHIRTRFSLWGSKAFTDNLSNKDGIILDLFGYGSDKTDLLFGNLGITMNFSLLQPLTNSRVFTFDASQVALDSKKSVRRDSSLAAHFPLRLRRLVTTNNLENWEKEGYRNINLNSVSDPISRQESWYGLEFTFNMGNLGKLMPEGELLGSLIAGWNATGDVYCALKIPAFNREHGLLAVQEMIDLYLPNFELLPSADGTYKMTTYALAHLFGKSYPIHLLIFQSLDTQKGQIGWYATTNEESE